MQSFSRPSQAAPMSCQPCCNTAARQVTEARAIVMLSCHEDQLQSASRATDLIAVDAFDFVRVVCQHDGGGCLLERGGSACYMSERCRRGKGVGHCRPAAGYICSHRSGGMRILQYAEPDNDLIPRAVGVSKHTALPLDRLNVKELSYIAFAGSMRCLLLHQT